jgi:hypothetical protein
VSCRLLLEKTADPGGTRECMQAPRFGLRHAQAAIGDAVVISPYITWIR